jgi:hypothetical protein
VEPTSDCPCESCIFRKWVRKVIISEKWGVVEAWRRNVQKCEWVKNGECSEVKWSEVKGRDGKWNKVMLGEMCVLSLIYIYVSVCMFCAVRCAIIIWLSLFSNYATYVLLYSFMFVFCFVCFPFCVFCVFVLFCVLFLLLYIAVCFPFLYQSTDHCQWMETQLR